MTTDAYDRYGRIEPWIYGALCLFMVGEVWSRSVFFTNDGSAHLYNARILTDMLMGTDAAYADFFSFNTFPEPNWTGHLLLMPLLAAFGPFVAEKVVVSLYVVLFLFGFRWMAMGAKGFNPAFTYLIFPFVFNFPLYTGFFNFCLGLGIMFITVGHWMRRYRWSRPGRGNLLMACLLLLGYFTHLSTFIMTGVVLGAFVMHGLADVFLSEKKIIDWTKETGQLALASALPLVLAVWYFIDNDGGGTLENTIPTLHQLSDLTWLKPIVVFHTGHEQEFTSSLMDVGIAAISASVLFRAFAVNRADDDSVRISYSRYDAEGKDVSRSFLIAAVLFFILYLKLPDDMSGGGFVQVRMALVFMLAVVAWLATWPVPRVLATLLVPITFYCIVQLNEARSPYMAEQGAIVRELMPAADHLPEGAVVLPIIRNHHWFMGHASNYLGTRKPLVIVDNYEACTGYFPVIWNLPVNPTQTLPFPAWKLCADHAERTKELYGRIDAVLLYQDSTVSVEGLCDNRLEQFIALGYREVYRSKSGKTALFLSNELK
jgi:hypothetical protein